MEFSNLFILSKPSFTLLYFSFKYFIYLFITDHQPVEMRGNFYLKGKKSQSIHIVGFGRFGMKGRNLIGSANWSGIRSTNQQSIPESARGLEWRHPIKSFLPCPSNGRVMAGPFLIIDRLVPWRCTQTINIYLHLYAILKQLNNWKRLWLGGKGLLITPSDKAGRTRQGHYQRI